MEETFNRAMFRLKGVSTKAIAQTALALQVLFIILVSAAIKNPGKTFNN
jgi:hypothetical protein